MKPSELIFLDDFMDKKIRAELSCTTPQMKALSQERSG